MMPPTLAADRTTLVLRTQVLALGSAHRARAPGAAPGGADFAPWDSPAALMGGRCYHFPLFPAVATMPAAEPPPPGDAVDAADNVDRAPAARQATLTEIIGAVLWSFFGVRKGEAMRRDAVTIKPHQVIIVGLVAAAMLVAGLLALVRIIVRTG